MYYPGYGRYGHGRWGHNHYRDHDENDFTEADGESFANQGDADFESDMGES